MPYEKKNNAGEKIIDLLENETLFMKPKDLQIPMMSPLDMKKKLDEDYERFWNALDLHFKDLIQNPKKEFINLLEITENHKNSLQKLDVLYKRSLEEIEKKLAKEKTPKFYSELAQVPSFNFNQLKKTSY